MVDEVDDTPAEEDEKTSWFGGGDSISYLPLLVLFLPWVLLRKIFKRQPKVVKVIDVVFGVLIVVVVVVYVVKTLG
jgi:arginine exporter protein ArgO